MVTQILDPLLQPFQLKHLTLRNRVVSTSHEPAFAEEGLPKDRYRRYHLEKAARRRRTDNDRRLRSRLPRQNPYPTGVKVSKAEIDAVPITRHTFHGEWNYTIHPEPETPPEQTK